MLQRLEMLLILPSRLYLHGYNSEFISPPSSFDDYKVGAKVDEKLYAVIPYNGTVGTKVSQF